MALIFVTVSALVVLAYGRVQLKRARNDVKRLEELMSDL